MISIILSLCGTNMNHYINMMFVLQAKADGHLVERVALYSILHTCKDGSAVNPVVQAKMVSNPFVVSFSLSIIAFASIEWFHNNHTV